MTNGGKRAVCVWHRRAGKDLTAAHFTAYEAARNPGNYWHMFPMSIQGRTALWNKVDKGKRVIDTIFPPSYVERRSDVNMTLKLTSGSTWQILGSDNYENSIGANPRGIVFSEYSLTDPNAWEYMRPILRENGGWAIFIFTPRWINHGYDLLQQAKSLDDWFWQVCSVRDTDMEHLAKAELRDGMPEELVQQEYYCFPPGTLVATSRGHVPIEAVREGDYVRTHRGRMRPVDGVISRQYDGDLVELRTAGSPMPLLCTPNHTVRLLDHESQEYRWCAAGDVAPGDSVVMPRIRLGQPIITREMALLIAWYIIEGSCSRTAVQFSLGREPYFVADIINAARAFDERPSVIYNGEVSVVQVKSAQLADFLAQNCGRGSDNKRIPFDLIAGHEEAVFNALIDGDGCRGDYSPSVAAVYTTVSRGLAIDMQMLAHALGHRALVNRQEGGAAVIDGREVRTLDSYSVRIDTGAWRGRSARRLAVRPAKNGVGCRVREVARIPYSGPVFNLSVRGDESYVAEGRVVHNCSFTSMNLGTIYARQMEDAEREGRLTKVPFDSAGLVDTYWDLGFRDATAIWFVQRVGYEIHLIDYIEDSFRTVAEYADLLRGETKDSAFRKKYRYGVCYLPHDARQRTLAAGGVSIEEQMRTLGFETEVVGSAPLSEAGFVRDRIDATRRILPRCWFDRERTARGIKALQSYCRKWDADRKVFSERPEHGWESHGSDAFGVMAIANERERQASRNQARRPILYPADHISNVVI